jgi:hypothetical protein
LKRIVTEFLEIKQCARSEKLIVSPIPAVVSNELARIDDFLLAHVSGSRVDADLRRHRLESDK